MADVRIIDLPETAEVYDTDELIVEQADGTKRASISDIPKQDRLTAGNGIQISGATISNVFANLISPDLNDIKYQFYGNVESATNVPSGVNSTGQLISVFRTDGARGHQFYMPYQSNVLYMRKYYASAWTEWVQLYTTSSLTAGSGISISNGVITNKFTFLNSVSLGEGSTVSANVPDLFVGYCYNCTGRPSGTVTFGTLIHIAGAGRISQTYTNLYNGDTYHRQYYGGSWTDWVELVSVTSKGSQTVESTYCTVVANWVKEGNICAVHGTVTPSTDISSSTGNVTISNLPKPTTNTFFTVGTSANTYVTVNGRLTSSSVMMFRGAMTNGTAYYFNFSYYCQ